MICNTKINNEMVAYTPYLNKHLPGLLSHNILTEMCHYYCNLPQYNTKGKIEDLMDIVLPS